MLDLSVCYLGLSPCPLRSKPFINCLELQALGLDLALIIPSSGFPTLL